MKKVFIVLLLLFIIVIFGSLAIRYFANSSNQDNWFNRDYRAKFSRYPILRTVYGLHWDGDAAADYLLPQPYKNIKIVLNKYDECKVALADLEPVRQEIASVVKKTGQVAVADGQLMTLTQDSYDRPGIRSMAGKFHAVRTAGDTAVVNIYCLNRFSDQPGNIGSTVNEDGVVIFYATLQTDAGSDADTLTKYLTSTILHEFGHQIGLDHGQDPTCLMDESVEIASSRDARFVSFIPVTFCDAEKQRIEEIRASLYTSK